MSQRLSCGQTNTTRCGGNHCNFPFDLKFHNNFGATPECLSCDEIYAVLGFVCSALALIIPLISDIFNSGLSGAQLLE